MDEFRSEQAQIKELQDELAINNAPLLSTSASSSDKAHQEPVNVTKQDDTITAEDAK